MAITVESFNGHDIQDATYAAELLRDDAPRSRSATPVETKPIAGFPTLARTQLESKVIPLFIEITGPTTSNIETLMQWFRPGTTGDLIVDFDGVRRKVSVTVIRIRPYDGYQNQFRVALHAADPRWRSEFVQTSSQSITSTATDFTLANDGTGVEDAARFYVRPYTLKADTANQRYKREFVIGWRSDRGATNYPIELTNGGWDHAAEVTASRSLATGNDVRVLVDGIEVPRWDGGGSSTSFNDTGTKVWANLTFGPQQKADLRANITASSPANGEDLEVDPGGLDGFPRSGFLLINSECISYHGITDRNDDGHAAFQNVVRGVRNTTAASHTAGDDILWVQHRVQLMYGYQNAAAPPDWSSTQPLINLDTSTNTSLVWDSTFSDDANPNRSLPWRRRLNSRDTLASQIIASGGSPDTQLDLEYSTSGAKTDQPVANEWVREFPVSLATGGATITYVDSNIATDNNTGTLTITAPSGLTDGDVMVTIIAHNDSPTPTITTLSGWTLLDSVTSGTFRQSSYYKVAASEGGSYAWTVSTAGSSATTGVVTAYRNVDQTNPVSISDAIVPLGEGNNQTSPPVFVDAPGSVVVAGFGNNGTTGYTPPTGWTEIEDSGLTGSNLEVAHLLDAGRGWQQPVAVSTSAGDGTSIVVLRPDAALSFTTTVSDTLAATAYALGDDGEEYLACAKPGAITSQVGAVLQGAGRITSVALGARSQVIARNPQGAVANELAVPVAVSAGASQQFTANGSGFLRAVRLDLDVDNPGELNVEIWSDDGADAPGAMISAASILDATATGDNQTFVFSFPTPPPLTSGGLYWIRIYESGNFTGFWNSVNGSYTSGVGGTAGTVFVFQALDYEIDTGQSDAVADDGDTVTYTAITATLEATDAPSIVFAAREDAYLLDATLRNLTTNQEIAFSRLLSPVDVIEIDVGQRAIRNLSDGPLQVQTTGTVTFDSEGSAPNSYARADSTTGHIQLPSRFLDEAQGGVVFRLNMGANGGAFPHDPGILFDLREDANNFIQLRWDDTLTRWELQRRNTGGTAEVTVSDTITSGQDVTVIAKWNEDNVSLSIDGATFTNAANTNVPRITATLMNLGSNNSNSTQIDSDIFWCATFTGTMTDADAATVHAFGNTDPQLEAFPADMDVTALWWANDAAYLAPGVTRGPSVVGHHDEGQAFDDPANWLALEPGNNVIQVRENGLAGLQVESRWFDVWE